ncbi:hypothetical protein K488DRAFT_43216 [Vararia minispora EC-137]|uniref:Uncharacterized protein n=1 Tax=Vararia minispora EC-137 TaxID=1314806 RepID=A0ACB8QUG5_9AGAM|nr:hypothetical protein K488DRAFT_43216 [Vararia minispora EC-137]
MSPKRPAPPSHPSPSPGILSGRTLHILDAKLDAPTIAHLHTLASKARARLVPSPADADVLVTAISMRRRLERHLDWSSAMRKAVVRPDWLEQSVERATALPCAPFAALRSLRDATAAHCPFAPSHLPAPDLPPYLRPPSPPPAFTASALTPFEKLSCKRACPLVCPTQDLVEYLDVIRRSRELEGQDKSALSYARAIGVIKSYPKRVSKETRKEVEKLPQLGKKLLAIIDEWLETGKVAEIETIRTSERFHSLAALASIYGIGPATARRLYGLGVRTLEELEVYYDVQDGGPEDLVRIQDDDDDGKKGKAAWKGNEADEEDAWIKVALALRRDFAHKLSREDVERIYARIVAELADVQPGCASMIVGGYRRGKPESGDIDIVFTHPDARKVPGLAKKLVKALHAKHLVTHILHSVGPRTHDPLRTTPFDALEKALTVFAPPAPSSVRRRVDLIFALPDVYWTAVVGWTGGTLFERDLRAHAKLKCVALRMKFDSSGISRRGDSTPIYPRSEKEVFDVLDLPWIPPEWRNADA